MTDRPASDDPAASTDAAPAADDPTAEIERLRSERDALRAKLDRLEGPPRPGRIRSIAVSALIVLLCISFLGSVVGVWAKRSVLNDQVFTERITPLSADPAVQAALGTWITSEIMETIDPQTIFKDSLPDRAKILAVPLANVVQGFVSDQVASFLASDRFTRLWDAATTQAHATAVKILDGDSEVVNVDNGEIVVNLLPIINEALAQIGQLSPEIFGMTVTLPTLTADDLPDVARERLSKALGVDLSADFGIIRIKDSGGALSTAQSLVRWFNILTWALVVLTVALVPLIVWLSRRRRRTLLQMTAGLLLVTVLLRRLIVTLQGEALSQVKVGLNRNAAASTLNQFVDPLLSTTVTVLCILVVFGAITVITGPYPWAVVVRRVARQIGRRATETASGLGDRATNETSIAWLKTHLTTLQVAGVAIGFFLLLWLDLSWLGLLVLALVIGGLELGLWWVAGRSHPPSPPAPTGGPTENQGLGAQPER